MNFIIPTSDEDKTATVELRFDPRVIFIYFSLKTVQDQCNWRGNEQLLEVKRKSPVAKLSTESMKDHLKEEIAHVLSLHNVRTNDREDLIEDIYFALKDLAMRGGDIVGARKNCSKCILKSINIPHSKVEKLSSMLVNRAREMSLIIKTIDSNEITRNRLNRANRQNKRYNDETKEIIVAPEFIKLQRKRKGREPELKAITQTVREIDDTTSLKMEVIFIPKDHKPSIIKDQLKHTLLKDINHIIDTSPLSKVRKKELKEKLNNLVEKDLDKSVLTEKQDIDNIKRLMLKDINEALDWSMIPKDKINMLKSKIAEVLDKDLDESILRDIHVRKKIFSRNIDDIIAKLPISRNEKHDLKESLIDIYEETGQMNINALPAQRKGNDGKYSFQGSKKYFAPKRHSTPKKYKESPSRPTNSMNTLPNSSLTPHLKENQYKTNPQNTSDNAETRYTKRLQKIIKTWLEKAPIHIESTAKNKIAEKLAGDIVDMKKYLQITPAVKPSYDGDLYHLNFKVHRRMKKYGTPEALTRVIKHLKELLEKINRVKVPRMPVPQGFLPREESETEDDQVPDKLDKIERFDSLNEAVADILDEENIFGDNREDLQTSLVSELAELTKSDANPDEILEAMIAHIEELTNLSDEEAEKLARKLLDTAKEIICPRKRLSFAPEKMKKKDFKDAMFRDVGNIFHGCPMSEEKRRLMEEQLAEQYADGLGISLDDSDSGTKATVSGAKKFDSDVTKIVNDWLKKLPITIDNEEEHNTFENNKRDFISKIKKLLPVRDFEKIHDESKKFLQLIPLDPDMKDDDELLNKKAKELERTLASLPSKAKGRNYGMSFKGLTDYIGTWLDNIHIQDETKNEDEIKDIKKDMAYDLVHKIGEMNVDPEIFNDDSLYEDVWRDELQNVLGDYTITDENIKDLKEDLIEKIKDAQRRAHDEIAGQTYKQNLRDTISNILPDPQTLSKDEQATLEILKDQLADAYIDLHYSGSDENLRAQLKTKIANEINTFCKNYLDKHPDSPLNSQKLNYDLYTALNNVPLPEGDSIRYEVEQARIREVINDWVRELPLQPQSPAELLARNKLVYMLSKKIFDIEVEVDDTKDVPLMRKEIIKFLNKMPLKPGEDNNMLADKLIDKLKNTEVSRKFSASTNVTIDAFGNVSRADSVCPYYKSLLDKQKAVKVCGPPGYRQPKSYPPCTLSPEDMDHLERIRQRSCLSPKCVTSLMKNNKRHTGVGPRPIDTGSQTELRPRLSPICPASNEKTPRPCPGVPGRSPHHSGHKIRRPMITSSNIQTDCRGEVQPHIIIKQYYWDPDDNSNFQESNLKQPGRVPCHKSGSSTYQKASQAPCHQTGTSPCIQSAPAPCHQTGSSPHQKSSPAPCHQIGTSTYQESDPAPCHQSDTSPYPESNPAPCHRHNLSPQQQPSPTHQQQQNTSPQRVPCDHIFTCPEPKSQRQPPPDRYSHWSPQRSFQVPQDRFSHRSIPCSRSPCTPSPCMSPLSSSFGPNQQSTPLSSSGYSFRHHDCKIPKRDGLHNQIPCTSNRPSRKERVIELGSLDDLSNPRPKNSNNFDWSYAKLPEDDNFWGAPCMRRIILDEGVEEPLLMEREHREERVRCKCKERLVPKCARTHSRTSHRQPFSHCNEDGHNLNNLNRCSKCCGLHCPYPSYLYFRH